MPEWKFTFDILRSSIRMEFRTLTIGSGALALQKIMIVEFTKLAGARHNGKGQYWTGGAQRQGIRKFEVRSD